MKPINLFNLLNHYVSFSFYENVDGNLGNKIVDIIIYFKSNMDLKVRYVKMLILFSKLVDVKVFLVTKYYDNGQSYITLRVIGYNSMVTKFTYISKSLMDIIPLYNREYMIEYRKYKSKMSRKGIKMSTPKTVSSLILKFELKYLYNNIKNLLLRKKKYPKNKRLVELNNYIFNTRVKDVPLTLKNYESFAKYFR